MKIPFQIIIIRHLGPGGSRGARPPLELRFYRVKIFKVDKISFVVLVGPPWVKIVPRPLIIITDFQRNFLPSLA